LHPRAAAALLALERADRERVLAQPSQFVGPEVMQEPEQRAVKRIGL
jgi:hypothetical protein